MQIAFEDQPTPVLINVLTLYRRLANEQIDLNPDYQRDIVWNEKQQMDFIESLYNGYIIQFIILCKRRSDVQDQPDIKVCIDGKQRLTSIKLFFSNEIGLKMYDECGRKCVFYYSAPPNKKDTKIKRRVMTPSMKSRIEDRTIPVVDVGVIKMAVEREIFNRVQFGKPLKRAEIINGRDTQPVRLAKALIDKFPVIRTIATGNRKEDLMFALQIYYYICRDITEVGSTNIERLCAREDPPNEDAIKAFVIILTQFSELVSNKKIIIKDRVGALIAMRVIKSGVKVDLINDVCARFVKSRTVNSRNWQFAEVDDIIAGYK